MSRGDERLPIIGEPFFVNIFKYKQSSCFDLDDTHINSFENLRKSMLAFQKYLELIAEPQRQMAETLKSVVEFQRQMDKMLKPYKDLISEIQEQSKSFKKIKEICVNYHERLRQNFIDIFSIIEDPKDYEPSKVKLRDEIQPMILCMVRFAYDMDNDDFGHLKERMLMGIEAHIREEYHLSLFCILSAIDGMLVWFYNQNCPGGKHPTTKEKLKVFFESYAFKHFVDADTAHLKFDHFFAHRHEIMHGGKNSHFDKNLSTAALFFLGITYVSCSDY